MLTRPTGPCFTFHRLHRSPRASSFRTKPGESWMIDGLLIQGWGQAVAKLLAEGFFLKNMAEGFKKKHERAGHR